MIDIVSSSRVPLSAPDCTGLHEGCSVLQGVPHVRVREHEMPRETAVAVEVPTRTTQRVVSHLRGHRRGMCVDLLIDVSGLAHHTIALLCSLQTYQLLQNPDAASLYYREAGVKLWMQQRDASGAHSCFLARFIPLDSLFLRRCWSAFVG